MTDNLKSPQTAPPIINGGTQIHLGLKTALGIAVSTITCVAGISAFFYSEIKEEITLLRHSNGSKGTTLAAMAARIKTLENGSDQQVAVTEYTPSTDNTGLNPGINLPMLGWTSPSDTNQNIIVPWASIPSLDPTSPISISPPSIYCQAPPTIMPDGSDNSANVCLVLPDPASAIDRIDALDNPTPLIGDLRAILK